MELITAIEERRSVRSYSSQTVDRQTLDKLAEAVRLAPSACNAQPWTLVFVTDPQLRERLSTAARGPAGTFNTFISKAPVIAAFVVEPANTTSFLGTLVTGRKFPLIDLGIAAEHLCLRACDLGLGTCMLGWFDTAAVKRAIKVPRSKTVGLLVTIGYPDPSVPKREKIRKGIEDIRRWDRYEG